MPCKLVEVSAHLAALSKQGGNSGQGFFSAAGNDDRFLDLDVVDGTADKSGEGEIQEFARHFNSGGADTEQIQAKLLDELADLTAFRLNAEKVLGELYGNAQAYRL